MWIFFNENAIKKTKKPHHMRDEAFYTGGYVFFIRV